MTVKIEDSQAYRTNDGRVHPPRFFAGQRLSVDVLVEAVSPGGTVRLSLGGRPLGWWAAGMVGGERSSGHSEKTKIEVPQ